MSKPPKKDLYQWNEAGYFGLRYKFVNDGYAHKVGALATLLYVVILSQTDRKRGSAQISLTELSRLTGLTTRHIPKHLQTLKAYAIIAYVQHQGKKHEFWPLHHEIWKSCPGRTTTRRRTKQKETTPAKSLHDVLPAKWQGMSPEQERQRRNTLLQQGEILRRGNL